MIAKEQFDKTACSSAASGMVMPKKWIHHFAFTTALGIPQNLYRPLKNLEITRKWCDILCAALPHYITWVLRIAPSARVVDAGRDIRPKQLLSHQSLGRSKVEGSFQSTPNMMSLKDFNLFNQRMFYIKKKHVFSLRPSSSLRKSGKRRRPGTNFWASSKVTWWVES